MEALKPTNIPAMRERYEAAVAKEKRLEAATQPIMKINKKADDGMAKKDRNNKRKKTDEVESNESDVDSEEDAKKSKKPKPRKKKKAAVVNEAALKNVGALKEEDEVQEGIAWSDSEESN